MSWLSGLAGRAESFLNQMDQAAATSLQEVGIGTPSPEKPVRKEPVGLNYEPVAQPNATPLSQKAVESRFTKSFKTQGMNETKPKRHEPPSLSSDGSQSHQPKSRSSTGMSTSLSSDMLMNFLNSPSANPRSEKKGLQTTLPARPRSSHGREKEDKRGKEDQWSLQGSGWGSFKGHAPSFNVDSKRMREGLVKDQGNDEAAEGLSSKPSLHHSSSPPQSLYQSHSPGIPPLDLDSDSFGNLEVPDSDSSLQQEFATQLHTTNTCTTQSSSQSIQTPNSDSYSAPCINPDSHTPLHSSPDSHISQPDPDSHTTPDSDNVPSNFSSTFPPSPDSPSSHGLVLFQPAGGGGGGGGGGSGQVTKQPKQDIITVEEKLATSSDPPGGSDAFKERISNLELENQLLRQEIGSLSEELDSIRTRSRESQRTETKLKEELKILREQCSKLEGHLRHMRSQEDDLTSALEARDSQIHILRIRLEESDQLNKSLKQSMEEGDKERERLLHDAGLSSTAQNQALESVNSQLQQVQSFLTSEREVTAALRNELSERESQFISEKQQLMEALQAQQREIQQLQFQYSEGQKELQLTLRQMQQLRREYEEYKTKAATILQNKERLISTLQSSEERGNGLSVRESALEEARLEKQQLLTQLHEAKQQVVSLREELQDTEDRHTLEMEQALQQVRIGEEALEEEKRRHVVTQDDLNKLNEEVDDLKNDYVREKGMLAAQLREKENEILILNTRIAAVGSSQSDSTRRDLEGRLQELTESLIQKQTTLEILSSEKNSLHLQLEKTKVALEQSQLASVTRQTAVIMDDGGREGSAQLRPMASILPSSLRAPRQHLNRVKNTLDQMDRFGIQMGWVLKRYPWIRLTLIGYMLLLHLWVTIVLLTYKPEVHGEVHGDSL